jgi:integrase/recombinase XerD
MVTSSVSYLEQFLRSQRKSTAVEDIGAEEIRTFVTYLQSKRRYSNHPFVRQCQNGLSDDSINCYIRSVRAFWSWLKEETVVCETPFTRVKIPKASRKIIRSFSDAQLQEFLKAIAVDTREGYRDYAMVLMFLDTGIRLSELTTLRLGDICLEERMMRVMGKGNKERMVPFGKGVQRVLWRYINHVRPEPSLIRENFLFLTADGRRLSKNRVEVRMRKYGLKAKILGVRCSPHTFRHTAAISFLRNGGDVFSLQRLLGHSSLEMTRRYCELADVDVQNAHATASPVDNLIHISPSGNGVVTCSCKKIFTASVRT